MNELLEILEDLAPDVDFENCDDLIDSHKLDSLTIITLISDIEDEFDITIPTVEIVPKNFNSVEAMMELIERLQNEED
jgi:acyl carrier protein